MQNIKYCYIGNIMQLNYCFKTSTRTRNTKAQSMSETLLSRRYGSYAYETPDDQSRTSVLTAERADNTIIPVMAGLPEERLDASTALTNVGVDCFGHFAVKTGQKNEK